MSSTATPEYPLLFCMGNPLLDIQVTNGEELLKKYDLKPNDAVLANEKQMAIYDDIVQNHKVTYVAGGAAQNAARGAAYCLPPKHVVYVGAVGDDDLADQLRAANEKEGVQSAYQVHAGQKTGACAVVITGHDRSLCTSLQAAESFTPDHLQKPEIKTYIDNAKFFYIGGFFLTHGIESAMEVAKAASGRGKFFKVQLDQILLYVDIVIGNETEAASYAESNGMADSSATAVAQAIANLPKHNASRPRLVLITQGSESTIVASSSPSASKCNIHAGEPNPKTYPVSKLAPELIVDTNAAGDAFAGGFLAAHVLGKELDECIEAGHKMAAMCIQQVGPQFKWPKEKIL